MGYSHPTISVSLVRIDISCRPRSAQPKSLHEPSAIARNRRSVRPERREMRLLSGVTVTRIVRLWEAVSECAHPVVAGVVLDLGQAQHLQHRRDVVAEAAAQAL